MKKALIIHGFEASGQSNWFPWLTRELNGQGWQASSPTFPNSSHPDYDEVIAFLRAKTADFGPHDILIGHSLGAFWALKLAEEKKFGGIFLVAPAVGELPYGEYRASWVGSDVDALEKVMSRPVDFGSIHAERKVVWFGKDDPLIPLGNAALFDDSWKVIRQEGYGHYCVLEFAGILKEVISY